MREIFETKSKAELIDYVLHYKGRLRLEKIESEWLDQIASSMRYAEDSPEYPEEDRASVKASYNRQIKADNLKL